MTIDVPEEPDVEPTEAAEAEAEQQMTAISFFTAARYRRFGFLGYTFQIVAGLQDGWQRHTDMLQRKGKN